MRFGGGFGLSRHFALLDGIVVELSILVGDGSVDP